MTRSANFEDLLNNGPVPPALRLRVDQVLGNPRYMMPELDPEVLGALTPDAEELSTVITVDLYNCAFFQEETDSGAHSKKLFNPVYTRPMLALWHAVQDYLDNQFEHAAVVEIDCIVIDRLVGVRVNYTLSAGIEATGPTAIRDGSPTI